MTLIIFFTILFHIQESTTRSWESEKRNPIAKTFSKRKSFSASPNCPTAFSRARQPAANAALRPRQNAALFALLPPPRFLALANTITYHERCYRVLAFCRFFVNRVSLLTSGLVNQTILRRGPSKIFIQCFPERLRLVLPNNITTRKIRVPLSSLPLPYSGHCCGT